MIQSPGWDTELTAPAGTVAAAKRTLKTSFRFRAGPGTQTVSGGGGFPMGWNWPRHLTQGIATAGPCTQPGVNSGGRVQVRCRRDPVSLSTMTPDWLVKAEIHSPLLCMLSLNTWAAILAAR
jgi:hypothetical protein